MSDRYEAPRRAVVPRQTTYRHDLPPLVCSDCGERIEEDQPYHEAENPLFGGVAMPVHDECPDWGIDNP